MIYAKTKLQAIPDVCLYCFHCGQVYRGGNYGRYYRCNITKTTISNAVIIKTRPTWCPLVEVEETT